ncbi:hypothetical protein [Pseudoalteromonas phage J2-1_QLiu-2017]|nr:hypothetical protein [Pseudoalteromonas phage J2-1_QLiu-2017]
MTKRILISDVSGHTPTLQTLSPKQFAMNTADGKIFYNNGTTIETFESGSADAITEARLREIFVENNVAVVWEDAVGAYPAGTKFLYANQEYLQQLQIDDVTVAPPEFAGRSYLEFDGVDDNVTLVPLDLLQNDIVRLKYTAPTQIVTNEQTLIDGITGFNRVIVDLETNGTFAIAGATMTVDGEVVDSNSYYPVDGKEHILELTISADATKLGVIGSRIDNSNFFKGRIYDVEVVRAGNRIHFFPLRTDAIDYYSGSVVPDEEFAWGGIWRTASDNVVIGDRQITFTNATSEWFRSRPVDEFEVGTYRLVADQDLSTGQVGFEIFGTGGTDGPFIGGTQKTDYVLVLEDTGTKEFGLWCGSTPVNGTIKNFKVIKMEELNPDPTFSSGTGLTALGNAAIIGGKAVFDGSTGTNTIRPLTEGQGGTFKVIPAGNTVRLALNVSTLTAGSIRVYSRKIDGQTESISTITSSGIVDIEHTLLNDSSSIGFFTQDSAVAEVEWFSITEVTDGILNGTPTTSYEKSYDKIATVSDIIAEIEKKHSTEVSVIDSATTEEEFLSVAESVKEVLAGSGFKSFGKHTGHIDIYSINEGMMTANYGRTTSRQPYLTLGNLTLAPIEGLSETNHAIVSVDGVAVSLIDGASTVYGTQIPFPDAPDATKRYNTDTGVVTSHSTSGEAFRGMLPDGDFSKGDLSEYFEPSGRGVNTWNSDNTVSMTNTVVGDPESVNTNYLGESVAIVTTQRYRATINVESISANAIAKLRFGGTATANRQWSSPLTVGSNVFEFTPVADESSSTFVIYLGGDGADSMTISSISLEPVEEKVITTRQDFVMLEVWHERVSDKDIFVPYGNVQYKGTSFEGAPLSPLTTYGVSQGYSAYGEWDTTTDGRARSWSGMSDEDKTKMLSIPENNLYINDADEYIQVRYRIRVIEGLGDEWYNTSPYRTDVSHYLAHFSSGNSFAVKPRGQRETITDLGSGFPIYTTHTSVQSATKLTGAYDAVSGVGISDAGSGYNGKCYSIPVALVQRLNKGAFHPSYNPLGCAGFRSTTNTSTSTRQWFENTVIKEIICTQQCFDTNNIVAPSGWERSGDLNDAGSGRTDQYDFYNHIYEGLVQDLRINANKLDTQTLLEDTFKKAVRGEIRGKSNLYFTRFYAETPPTANASSSAVAITKGDASLYQVGDIVSVVDSSDSSIVVKNVEITSIDETNPDVDWLLWSGNTYNRLDSQVYFAIVGHKLPMEFVNIPWVDIIGDPVELLQVFPDGVIGKWNPLIPDGTVQQTYSLGGKNTNTQMVTTRTIDQGTNWAIFPTVTISTIENVLRVTLPAPTYAGLWEYPVLAGFTTPATGKTKSLLTKEEVYLSSSNQNNIGNLLHYSLTGNIGTNDGTAAVQQRALQNYYYGSDGVPRDSGDSVVYTDWSHAQFSSLPPDNGSSAFKTVFMLVEEGGMYTLQMFGEEMVANTLLPIQSDGVTSPLALTQGDVVTFTGGALAGHTLVAKTTTSINPTSYYIVDGRVLVNTTGNESGTLRVFNNIWGDGNIISLPNSDTVKENNNGRSVKIFNHKLTYPLGIAS